MSVIMRFGLPGGRGELGTDGPSSNREAVRTADRLGFDSLWFTDEPARSDDATTWRTRGSALALATVAAVTTTHVRLGLVVTPDRLRRPLRLAADIATLDVLAHGRITLVLGAGTPPADAETALDTMLACWAGRPVRLDGEWHTVEPAPVQRPRPQVFATACDDETITWAARQGYGVVLAAGRPAVALRRELELFARHGGDPDAARVERFCLVAESDAAARRDGGPYVAQLASYLQATTSARERAGLPADAFSTDRLVGDTILAGGPDTVAERIAALRDEVGVRCVNVRPSLRGHCPFALQRVTVELFAAGVAPLLGGMLGTAARS